MDSFLGRKKVKLSGYNQYDCVLQGALSCFSVVKDDQEPSILSFVRLTVRQ